MQLAVPLSLVVIALVVHILSHSNQLDPARSMRMNLRSIIGSNPLFQTWLLMAKLVPPAMVVRLAPMGSTFCVKTVSVTRMSAGTKGSAAYGDPAVTRVAIRAKKNKTNGLKKGKMLSCGRARNDLRVHTSFAISESVIGQMKRVIAGVLHGIVCVTA
ncbi:uncharacterized protein Dvar_69980 [Desulfosarcina variabilis str. Montpellier]|uniref:hypothetical protein n=1 Tax=Desulfosarcina variabilis TaxID=2300 RepID=UPI003AFA91EC